MGSKLREYHGPVHKVNSILILPNPARGCTKGDLVNGDSERISVGQRIYLERTKGRRWRLSMGPPRTSQLYRGEEEA
jgi:hypothetical protein